MHLPACKLSISHRKTTVAWSPPSTTIYPCISLHYNRTTHMMASKLSISHRRTTVAWSPPSIMIYPCISLHYNRTTCMMASKLSVSHERTAVAWSPPSTTIYPCISSVPCPSKDQLFCQTDRQHKEVPWKKEDPRMQSTAPQAAPSVEIIVKVLSKHVRIWGTSPGSHTAVMCATMQRRPRPQKQTRSKAFKPKPPN